MITSRILGAVVILSAFVAKPALAQHMIEEPGMYSFYHPNGDLGLGSTPPAANAMAALPGNGKTIELSVGTRRHAVRDRRVQAINAY